MPTPEEVQREQEDREARRLAREKADHDYLDMIRKRIEEEQRNGN